MRKLRFLNRLSDRRLTEFLPIAAIEYRIAGRILFHEGAICDRIFFVADGAVALDMFVPLRGSVRVLTLGASEFFTWSALLDNRRTTVTATVIEDATLVCIPARSLWELCDRDPESGFTIMQCLAFALSDRLLATRLQFLDLFRETQPVSSEWELKKCHP